MKNDVNENWKIFVMICKKILVYFSQIYGLKVKKDLIKTT